MNKIYSKVPFFNICHRGTAFFQFMRRGVHIRNKLKQKVDKDFAAKYCLNLVQYKNARSSNSDKDVFLKLCRMKDLLAIKLDSLKKSQLPTSAPPVTKSDYENFLCTLILKDEHLRRDAFALRAFNVEVAKCNANVTDDQIAKMRLKFWHDSVDKCFVKSKNYTSDHPVLKELKNTIEQHHLTKLYMKRLVTARDRLSNQQFSTLKEMEDYSEQSFSSLLYLLAECKDCRNLEVDHALSHLGKAHGLATLLRSIPYKGRGEAINIPQEILIRNGVSQERVLRHATGKIAQDKGVEDCIFEVATAAHQHLEQSRKLADEVPSKLRKILLPAVAVDRYLERLRKANFRLSDQNCMQRDALLPMALYWYGLRNKY